MLEDVIKTTVDVDYLVPTPDLVGGTPATPGSGIIDIITDLEELGGEDPFTDVPPGRVLFRIDLEGQTVSYQYNTGTYTTVTFATIAGGGGVYNFVGGRVNMTMGGVFTLSFFRQFSNAPGGFARQATFNGENLAAVASGAPQSAVEAIVSGVLYDTTNTAYPNIYFIDYANPTAATTPPEFPSAVTYRHSFELSPTTPTNATTTYLRLYTTARVAATPAVPGTPEPVIYDPSSTVTLQEFQDFLNQYYTDGTPNPTAQAAVACLAAGLFVNLVAAVRYESQLSTSSICGGGNPFGTCGGACGTTVKIVIN